MNFVTTSQGIGQVLSGEAAILDLQAESWLELLQEPDWRDGLEKVDIRKRIPLSALEVYAPITPRDFWLVGSNYPGRGKSGSEEPSFFLRSSSSLSGPGSAVRINEGWGFDFDAEIAVVIGAPTYRVKDRDAWSHIAGYTGCNDMTAREFLQNGRGAAVAKSYPGFGALGASLRIVDADPGPLNISLEIDGKVWQEGVTSDMLYSISELVAKLSYSCPLRPGDVIATGAPSRTKSEPPIALGTTMRLHVDGVMPLETRVEEAASWLDE
ncbi:fumarylacetoacetate hydrolase family protein [Nesterenkonia ebinurensis]|uniref:fumarylacetoacetate hydrolase family protein n=1 Tax=Nesterenkonia ebinurensis TaxID=2608252 RepID=UPI00168BE92E|nr:fumarylacetoacetate hydrolase family protein [Nesterenkonia ebinurensis]